LSSVYSRTFRSSPHRDATQTWLAIVDLLTSNSGSTNARHELLSVKGVVSSIIAEKSFQDSPLVVTCNGPRTRIYCIYDEEAIEGGNENEDSLGFDPLNGDWSISVPCPAEDLEWAKVALKRHSDHIYARDASNGVAVADEKAQVVASLSLNLEEFLKP
jgi:hypothetical protein